MRAVRSLAWVLPVILAPDLAAQCNPHWGNSFPVANGGSNDLVYALNPFDADGAGPNPPLLVAGGDFSSIGNLSGVDARGIAAWNGSTWLPMGSGVSGGLTFGDRVNALLEFDADGGGPNPPLLYVGGNFRQAGSSTVRSIASWDGSIWSPVGYGFMTDFNSRGIVNALAVFDSDGAGPGLPQLHAAGEFSEGAPGIFLDSFARWDGTAWVRVGGGISPATGPVHALTVFDQDGIGPGAPALFVGGSFFGVDQGNQSAANIARWSGTTWSTLGSGMNAQVYALTVFDDDGDGPNPPALYAGGAFTIAGGVSALRVAKWNGASWSALGSGMDGVVSVLTVFDDDGVGPNPPALYAGGFFSIAGGVAANRIAKWNGSAWSAVDGGVGGSSTRVSAMTVIDPDTDGPSPSTLYIGGEFALAGVESSGNIASWIGCGSSFATFCSGDGSLPTPCPCVPPNTVPNPPAAPGHGCANWLNPSGALLTVSGSTWPDTVKFSVQVAPNYAAFAFLHKGSARSSDGIAYGDGVRCVDGQLLRFGGHFAGTNGDPSGTWSYPNAVQVLPVSTMSAQPPASTAYYQLFYRNAATNFCTPGTTNYSNGAVIQWL